MLSEQQTYKVKTVRVKPGFRLSYQRHKKRAEHWFIVEGHGEVTLDGIKHRVQAGQGITFGVGVLHRIQNVGVQELVFV